MSAEHSAAVRVRGHSFTVYYLPIDGKLPSLLALYLSEYPDDILRIIDERVLDLIRVETLKAHRDQEAYVARRVAQEGMEA